MAVFGLKNQRGVRLQRLLLISGVVLALAALVLWALWPRPVEVEVAQAVRGEIRAWVEEQGITRVPHVHKITMPIDGRVRPIDVIEGQAVRQGEVVAHLEPDDIESELAEIQARIAQIEAQLVEARDVRLELTALDQINEFLVSLDRTVEAAEEGVRATEARRDFASDQLRRAQQAHASGALAETELDRRRLEMVEAEANHSSNVLTLRATMATREAARLGPRFIHEYIEQRTHRRQQLLQDQRQAEAHLERLQRDLGRAAITSPVGGVVFSRAVVNETMLPAGSLLLEIGQLDELEIEAEVLSEEVVRFGVGARAEVFGGAVGTQPVPAVVARIYPQGFTKVSALGIEQQRVLVVLRFAQGEVDALRERGLMLGSDFRVRVRVLADEREDALRIPRTAVFRSADGGWRVFVVRGGRAALAYLDVGLMTPRDVEVLTGLETGEEVVLSPPADLSAGVRVRRRGH